MAALAFALGVTGTPGTGKKSVARLLAKRRGLELLDIASALRAHGLVEEGGEVDVEAARPVILMMADQGRIVTGHLLPYILRKGEVKRVAVLRCHPYVLIERLRDRGYGAKKVEQNVLAEALDLIYYDAVRAFGRRRVAQFDTTHKAPEQVADEIEAWLERRAAPSPPPSWLDELGPEGVLGLGSGGLRKQLR
jgi:adenylate kinase